MTTRWSKRARADLRGLAGHISIDNPRAALAVWDKIDERVGRLAEQTEIGRPGRVKGTRELVITRTPYIVVYRLDDGVVHIERVLNGAQRWPPKR